MARLLATHARYIHLHVPRSGGSYVQGRLSGGFRKGNVLAASGNSIQNLVPQFADLPVLYSGHIFFDNAGIRVKEDHFLIPLRDPMARLESMFRYVLDRPEHKLNGLIRANADPINAVLGQPQFVNLATRLLAGKQYDGHLILETAAMDLAIKRVDQANVTIGTIENIGRFMERVERRCGLRSVYDQVGRNESPELPAEYRDLWAQVAPKLLEANTFDIALYEHVRRRDAAEI